MISTELYFRLDFTADNRYTLSNATENILSNLDDVITITAFFSEELPPQLLKTREDFQEQLVEYEKRSGGNIVYEFVNPNKNDEAETEAQQSGIGPLIVNVTDRDQVSQMRAYMGALLQMGDRQEVIPVVQPGASMEYMLTTAIKKISIENKPKVAFLQGHGEAPLNSLGQINEQLSVLYQTEEYTISDTTEIPVEYRALAVLNPTDTFPIEHLQQLDNFLRAGNGIFIAYSTLSGNLQNAYLSDPPDIGIESWLENKGITMEKEFVVDANSGNVSVRQQSGPFVFNTQIQFPFFPIISNFAEHPVTSGLESIILPFVNKLELNAADTTVQLEALAWSSEQSGTVTVPNQIDINKEWAESDFLQPEQIVAASFNGSIGNGPPAKMVVVANGSFAVNGRPGQGQRQLNPDNVSLATNAIDWLSDDTGLIELRTKGVTNRPLQPVDPGMRALIKYGNVFIPIFIILGYAFYRRQRNARKRHKWMNDNY